MNIECSKGQINSLNCKCNEQMIEMASVEVNQKAPDLDIDDYKGVKFKLSEFKGKNNVLIVLNRGFV